MRATSLGAFFLSALVHLAAVLLVILTAWLLRRPVEQPIVFELVEPPGLAAPLEPSGLAPEPAPLTPPEPQAPPPPEPEPAPAPPVMEKPAPPPPQPTPPVAKPEPKPEPKPVAKAAPKPEPKKEEPPQQRGSYADFIKQHGKPKVTQPAHAPSKPVVAPRIDTSQITQSLRELSASARSGNLSTHQLNELESYLARLIGALRAAHRHPPGLSDLLSTRVAFHIAADGTLSRARIAASSGNAAFDRSVLDAFSAVRSVGRTPGGISEEWVLTFRVRDH